MKPTLDALPKELHEYIAALEQQNAALQRQMAELTAKLRWYEERLRIAQHRRFGSSSERTASDQEPLPLLFDEAELIADPKVEEPTTETITHTRRKAKGKRDQDLEDLPVERIEYRLPEEERTCAQCHGELHEMSVEVRRELKVIPAQVKVVEHVQVIYACRTCEREGVSTPIVTAKAPAPAIPGSLASPSALAHVMAQKFVEGLPLYRQEQHFERLGIPLSRQTMANWMIESAGRWLVPLYHAMRQRLLQEEILHADETTLQVLHEPDRAAQTQSYMWVYRTGRDGPPIVLFDYQPTRSGEHPKAFLSGFKGYLHVDGYSGYEGLSDVTLVGCWAHARRQFDEAIKALPPSARSKGPVTAEEGLAYCNRLFSVERTLKGLDPQARHAARQARSVPILNEFHAWLKKQEAEALPKGALGKAVRYCLNQWEKLTAFLKDGRLEIDNNRTERSIKPFVIGRKNWLFANTPRGARSSAVIYSIIETAKENGLNPFAYLEHLFERLPNVRLDDATLDAVMPWADTLPDACRLRPKKA